MTRVARLSVAFLFVMVVGTANSAGYRFGVSDQAFYIPAIALRAAPELFPRDRAVFEPQMRFWLGDELLGSLVRVSGVDLPELFALLYVLTMAGMTIGAIWLARSLGCDWWAIAVCLVLVTLRHRIARTGANSLEGYMHPRMLAFACGLVALGYVVRRRPVTAAVWTAVAAVVHTSTAIWFGGVVTVAAAWPHMGRRSVRIATSLIVTLGLAGLLAAAAYLPRMDAAWLAVLGDRDYLFSADWPLYAWIGNLAYPAVLYAIYRRRQAKRAAVPGESALIVGLLVLVAAFLITIPLAEWHVAFFVQLQANRVFWVLDAVVAVYVAWWLTSVFMAQWPAGRKVIAVGLLATLAIARGVYVLHETNRPLAQMAPTADDWMEVMGWLRTQPASWHVLADPGHAWKHGISLRAAALRDTPLETGKDPAMAMYDRTLAARVADTSRGLVDFDAWQSLEDVRRADDRYGIDAFVDRADRTFPLPILFRNQSFVVYDLR